VVEVGAHQPNERDGMRSRKALHLQDETEDLVEFLRAL
jgi:hypothetical protein